MHKQYIKVTIITLEIFVHEHITSFGSLFFLLVEKILNISFLKSPLFIDYKFFIELTNYFMRTIEDDPK